MEPYLGEIRIFAGNFAPVGWANCDGSLQSIAQNSALFALLGTTYGGDGVTTFALPDLRGRVILNQGRGLSGTTYVMGMSGGVESVTLLNPNLPSHQHTLSVSSQSGTTTSAANNFLAAPADPTTNNHTVLFYAPPATGLVPQPLLPNSLTPTGGSQSHENRMPYLSISYIIAMEGIFPSFS